MRRAWSVCAGCGGCGLPFVWGLVADVGRREARKEDIVRRVDGTGWDGSAWCCCRRRGQSGVASGALRRPQMRGLRRDGVRGASTRRTDVVADAIGVG